MIFLKKTLTIALLLTTFFLSAQTTTSIDANLIKEMAQNENVMNFIDNSIAINIGALLEKDSEQYQKQSTNDTSNRLNERIRNHKELTNKVYKQYPAFEKMSTSEKVAILKEITSVSEAKLATWSCVREEVLKMLTCAGVTTTGWAAAKFWICSTTVFIADLVILIDQPELGIDGWEEGTLVVKEEAVECLRFAAGASLSVATGCAANMIGGLYDCF